MIPVSPETASASERPVDRLCDPDREALDTAREPHRLVRFHQQVQMIGLHAELEDPESPGAGGRQSIADRREDLVASEAGNASAGSQGHVNRTSGVMNTPPGMCDTTPTGPGLPPGALAGSAPRADSECELQLPTVSDHLIRQ